MKKKITIIVGTRPNFIKITQFEKEFNKYPEKFEYKLIHTGQHYDENMSNLFFKQLELKRPDIFIETKGLPPGEQIGKIITELTREFLKDKPDLVIVPGDVNSTLAASIAANKTGCLLAHLESGLRSKDLKMPEEHNRILTDHLAKHLFVTEQSGLDNLSKDFEDEKHIHFVGNTMIDTLVAYNKEIDASPILEELNAKKGEYALMTMHRPSNVDTEPKLKKMLALINFITKKRKLVFPIHPRTKKNLEKFGLFGEIENNEAVIISPPLGYLAFQKLIGNATFVVTDSGGIQEETTFRQVPCLTVRENTERPSTIDVGTNKLVAFDSELISKEIESIENGTYKKGEIPPFWDGKATQRIVKAIDNIWS